MPGARRSGAARFSTGVIAVTACSQVQGYKEKTGIRTSGDEVHMSPSNDSSASQPALESDECSADTIYDRIHNRTCSLLTEQPIAKLRDMLRSIMTHADLTSFCTDRSKLSLISYDPPSGGHGPARAFRSSVLAVRLMVFVETDRTDSEVQRVQVTADIQDGNQTATHPLVEWVNSIAIGPAKVNHH